MIKQNRDFALFGAMALLFVAVGFLQSWNLSLAILNLGLISAIMALGVNIQWGYAGLLNVGVMGFAALGGLAAILVSAPPVQEAWAAGGSGILFSLIVVIAMVLSMIFAYRRLTGTKRRLAITAIGIIGYFVARSFFSPATNAIEQVNPATSGYLGGFGMPIILSWVVGGFLQLALRGLLAKSHLVFGQIISPSPP